jgi:serine/threonine protein kinase
MLYLSPRCRFGENFDDWQWRLPKQWAKRASRESLLGLQYLHANGIVHGDIHGGNILFTAKLPSPERLTPEKLEPQPSKYSFLQRKDNKIDLWAPRYILEPVSLYDYTSEDLDPLVKICDLGGGKMHIDVS